MTEHEMKLNLGTMTEHEMKLNLGTMEVQCSCGQSFDPVDAIAHLETLKGEALNG